MLTTIIVVAVTVVMAVCGGVMIYAKNCDDKTKEDMGVRI